MEVWLEYRGQGRGKAESEISGVSGGRFERVFKAIRILKAM